MKEINHKIVTGCAVAILLIAGILVVYGYKSNSENGLSTAMKKILPAVTVGNNTISLFDWNKSFTIAKQLDPNASDDVISDKIIERVKMQIIAADLKLDWKEVAHREQTYFINNNLEEYNKFLSNYFSGNGKLFVEYVAEPSAVDAVLRTHYNNQQKGSNQYSEADNLLQRILGGEKFEGLAKLESEDKPSAQFSGDLGFFKRGEILPELEAQIIKGPIGEVQREVFVSRYGYHIVYPVETAQKDSQEVWHAKHILIKSSGYETWFKEQSDNIKTRFLVK